MAYPGGDYGQWGAGQQAGWQGHQHAGGQGQGHQQAPWQGSLGPGAGQPAAWQSGGWQGGAAQGAPPGNWQPGGGNPAWSGAQAANPVPRAFAAQSRGAAGAAPAAPPAAPQAAPPEEVLEDFPVGLFGDTHWFARPQNWKGPALTPQGSFQQATANLPQAGADQGAALQVVTAAMNSPVVPPMAEHTGKALMSEAARLLAAVLGFSGEGLVPAQMRMRALSRAMMSTTWPCLIPAPLLSQWYDYPALIGVFGGEPIRKAFDEASKPHRMHFVCALSRVAALEVGTKEVKQGTQLRCQWAKVFELFPEIRAVRQLQAHVRRRCWEDVRDRSRSRSRSRDKKKKEPKPGQKGFVPPDASRFFIKGCAAMTEKDIEKHFGNFGHIHELSVLYDKRTKKSRGMGFVTLKPKGKWEGSPVTKEQMNEWMLGERHVVDRCEIEVTLAEEKGPEDEERKHEERVEERRRARLEKDGRMGRDSTAEAKYALSPWAKRWRQEVLDLFQGSAAPTPWSSSRLKKLSLKLWEEIVQGARRAGEVELQVALKLFEQDPDPGTVEATVQWAHLPAASLLLVVADGLLGITSEGLFAADSAKQELEQPPDGMDISTMKTMAPPAAAATAPGGPVQNSIYSSGKGEGLQRGGSDREKIFVGGLTPNTNLDTLMAYFKNYGTITDAVVMMDKMTGKPRGFGFVVFDDVSAVDRTLKDYGQHRIDGKWVDVKRAVPQAAEAAGAPAVAFAGGEQAGGGPVGSRELYDGGAGGAAAPAAQAGSPQASPQSFSAAPPPSALAAPPQSFSAAPPPNFNSAPPPSFSAAPPPSFNSAPPPSFNSAPPPSFNSAPPPEASPANKRVFSESTPKPDQEEYDPLA